MNIFQRIGRWWRSLFQKKDIEQALNIKIATPPELLQRFEIWRQAMDGQLPHNQPPQNIPSLFTAANLVSRVAKMVALEFKTEITGHDYVNEQYQRFINAKPGGLRKAIESGLSGGRYLLFPTVRGENIVINVLDNDNYFPTRYGELKELTGVIVPLGISKWDEAAQKQKFYTLLIQCEYESKPKLYTMTHTAWVSEDKRTLGMPISLDSVEEWALLPQEITFHEVDAPWFVEYVSPKDGAAIFDRAIDHFRKLDMQKARTEWEFEGGELAIDGSVDLFRKDEWGNPIIPAGKQRLFRSHEAVTDGTKIENVMQTFSPDLRGEEFERGSNEIKRDIEDACELARGTISDVNLVAQTATEIEFTHQVTFTTISDVQTTTGEALKKLVAVLVDMAYRYYLSPKTAYDVTLDWDDSIIVDQKEWQEEVKGELHELNTLLAENIVTPAMVLAFAKKNLKNFSLLTEKEIQDAEKELPAALPPDDTGEM